MPDRSDIISMLARAQRIAFFAWLLGMRKFNIMPTRPGDDPMTRMRTRLLTIIEALAALVVTLATLIVVGLTALFAAAGSPAPAACMLVGGTVSLVLVLRAVWRCVRAAMPVPGLAWLVGLLNVAATGAAAAMVLASRSGAA